MEQDRVSISSEKNEGGFATGNADADSKLPDQQSTQMEMIGRQPQNCSNRGLSSLLDQARPMPMNTKKLLSIRGK
eukprot:5723105-Amphidinium_carterae.1